MQIDNKFKDKINKCVVRILAEDININWSLPYLLDEPSKGQGTGFFIDDKGHILTCAHVVNAAKNVYIEIPEINSSKYDCEIIFICPQFDIALLKTKKYKSKDFLLLGDSDKLNVGTEVQVVGYPVSYSTSSNNVNNLKYTVGIISGQQKGFIQTDSAINPGNSGGPLFCNNKIIGINSMKLIGDSLENIGYAIPINYYKVISQEINHKKIIFRPNLLFGYNNTDKNIINQLTNGKSDNGVIVSKIYDGSVLENSGITKDCIISEINNIKIDNYGLTQNYKWLGTSISIDILLNTFKNNDIITIKYYDVHGKSAVKIKLTPYVPITRLMYSTFENIEYFILGGMIFMNFCANHLLNVDKNRVDILYIMTKPEELLKPRLIISYIFPNSKIDILNNINQNDFISKINDISVNSLDQLQRALKKPVIINNNEYIKFETENERSIILSIEDIISQDILFSEIYKYPLNDFHVKYTKKINVLRSHKKK